MERSVYICLQKEQRGGGPKGNKDRLNHERVKKWTKVQPALQTEFCVTCRSCHACCACAHIHISCLDDV